jgi:hypothetical protein
MSRTCFFLALLASLVLGAPASGEAAEATDYAGTFALADATATEAALEGAVEQGAQQFAAVIRPIARRTLRKVVRAVGLFTFEPGPNAITIRTDENPDGWATDLAGTEVEKVNGRGESITLRRWMQDGALRTRACTDAGCSEFTFSLTDDRQTMQLHVHTTSERLAEPLRYTLVYARK